MRPSRLKKYCYLIGQKICKGFPSCKTVPFNMIGSPLTWLVPLAHSSFACLHRRFFTGSRGTHFERMIKSKKKTPYFCLARHVHLQGCSNLGHQLCLSHLKHTTFLITVNSNIIVDFGGKLSEKLANGISLFSLNLQ